MSNTNHTFHATAVAAVNQALVTLGQDVVLTELSAGSEVVESRKSAFLYDAARLKVLRDHNWNFARREAEACGCTVSPEADELGFAFSCPVPPRCVRVLACLGGFGRGEVRWRLFGQTVRSDLPVGRIVYVADVEDLDRWSPDAYRALVIRLAADLAKPITGRINERQLQESAYGEAIEAAKLADARETNTPDDVWGENRTVRMMRGGFGGRRGIDFRR